MTAQKQTPSVAAVGSLKKTHPNLKFSDKSDTDEKCFATLAAQYALAGHSLVRSNPADGAQALYSSRWGHIKPLASLEATARFLLEIGRVQ